MAVVCITEFVDVAPALRGQPPELAPLPAAVEQTVAITAGSVQSAAMGATTRVVRVHADSVCAIAFGTNPTAVAPSGTSASATGTMRFAAGQTEYFGVPFGTGSSYKFAVITSS